MGASALPSLSVTHTNCTDYILSAVSHRFIAQIQHLAELHLQDPVLDLAERQHSSISILDLDLDTIAAAIGFTKQTLVTVAQASDGKRLS